MVAREPDAGDRRAHEELAALAHVARRRGRGRSTRTSRSTPAWAGSASPVERAAELAVEARARRASAIVGLMTHFACADTDDPADPAVDDARPARAVRRGRSRGGRRRARRCACATRRTARARCCFPEARFDLVRSRHRDLRQRSLGRRARRASRRCASSPRSRSCAAIADGRARSATARPGARRATAGVAILPCRLRRRPAAARERPCRGRDPRQARAARRPDQHGHRDRRRHRRRRTPRSAMRPCCSGARAAVRRSRAAEYGAWAGLVRVRGHVRHEQARAADVRRRTPRERATSRRRRRPAAAARRPDDADRPASAEAPARHRQRRRQPPTTTSRSAVRSRRGLDRRQGRGRAGLSLPRHGRRSPDPRSARALVVAAAPAVPRPELPRGRRVHRVRQRCRSCCSSARSPAW